MLAQAKRRVPAGPASPAWAAAMFREARRSCQGTLSTSIHAWRQRRQKRQGPAEATAGPGQSPCSRNPEPTGRRPTWRRSTLYPRTPLWEQPRPGRPFQRSGACRPDKPSQWAQHDRDRGYRLLRHWPHHGLVPQNGLCHGQISALSSGCRTRSTTGSPRRSTPGTRQRTLAACSERSDIQPAARTTNPRQARARRQR